MPTFGDEPNPTKEDDKETPSNEGSPKQETGESTFTYDGRTMTTEDVEKKLRNADEHIQRLERERAEDRENTQKMLDRIEEQQKQVDKMNDLYKRMETPTKDDAGEDDRKSLDEDQLAERAADAAYRRMVGERQEEERKQNQKEVYEALRSKYGDKADEETFAITRELGYTDEEAVKFAGEKPKAFLKLVGVTGEDKSKGATPTRGDVRSTPSDDAPKKAGYEDLVYGTSTKNRIAAFDQRVADRLKELGIN